MNTLTKFVRFLFTFTIFTWLQSVTCLVSECNQIRNISATHFKYTSFNHGIICKSSQKPVKPKTLADIQEIIKSALRNRLTVKPLGNLYSATDIICTDGIPLSLSNIRHFKYDYPTNYVTVGVGVKLRYMLESLHKYGRTMNGIPTYSDITIGGAIATGAHGTNLQNPATLSDDIISLIVVDGLGNVRNISDANTLRAFRANLGLLGVIYEIKFSTVPQFKLHIQHYPQSDQVLWQDNKILRLAKSTDRFQFFWFPSSKQVVMSVGHRVSVNTTGNCQTNFITEVPNILNEKMSRALEIMQKYKTYLGFFVLQEVMKLSLYQRVPIRRPIFSCKNSIVLRNPAIGFSHRMSTNKCDLCGWSNGKNRSILPFEMAVIIPLSELQGAMKTMKNILDEYPAEFPLLGIYFRFLKGSNGLLNVNSGRDSVAIEWIMVQRDDLFGKPMIHLAVSQALILSLIHQHQGRPHWGKSGLLYTPNEILVKLYPKLRAFVEQMEQFDSKGIFLNDFGRRIRFGCRETSIDSYIKHCALVGRCICVNDRDCGDGSADSNICGIIKGFHVCKERSRYYRLNRWNVLRNRS